MCAPATAFMFPHPADERFLNHGPSARKVFPITARSYSSRLKPFGCSYKGSRNAESPDKSSIWSCPLLVFRNQDMSGGHLRCAFAISHKREVCVVETCPVACYFGLIE